MACSILNILLIRMHVQSEINRGYYTVARRYAYYFRMLKTIFCKRAQRVNKISFSKRENNVHLFIICARLELFCDFLQSDWLHERVAFYDSCLADQNSFLAIIFMSNKWFLRR